jgi:hypothetical protein
MSNESQIQSEKEKQRKSEAEAKLELGKTLEFSKEKKEVIARLGKKKELAFLKSLVERGLLGVSTAERIVSDESLETEEIEAIFEKIDAIEQVPAIEKILPKYLRLTKDEYVEALTNANARAAALRKIDDALTRIYEYGHPNDFATALGVFFSGFMILNRHLVLVQEHTIDIKHSLTT